jgi:flavin reductase (DIM6/NTAB) family NADH-FMN oxidoreductase RutF
MGLPNVSSTRSYFGLISHNPPMVTVSVGVRKDTYTNIVATKEFVVNIVSEAFVQAMNATSIAGPPELDEWEVSGLVPLPSVSRPLPFAGIPT